MEMENEILDHPFLNRPNLLLGMYPGIKTVLERRAKNCGQIDILREYCEVVEYKGWTCEVYFLWKAVGDEFKIQNVRIFKKKKISCILSQKYFLEKDEMTKILYGVRERIL